MVTARWPAGNIAFLILLFGTQINAQEVSELPIDASFSENIVVGKSRPGLKLKSLGRISDLHITVERSGAKTKSFRLKSLAPGKTRNFRWNESPGIYSYAVTIRGKHGSSVLKRSFTMDINYLPPLKISLDRQRVDLENRTITFQLNHPADRAELVIKGAGGNVISRSEEEYSGAQPGQNLTISWTAQNEEITRIDLIAYSTAGFWVGMALTPWSVEIPHEEVVFETDRWEIRPSETPKLDEAVERIQKAIRDHGNELEVNLYVAGFTDTVGTNSHNRTLSENRAKAIARYFARNRVKVPIYFRGFGEEALSVPTPDETSEAKNRRAAYILATQPPTLSKSIGWGTWRRLP